MPEPELLAILIIGGLSAGLMAGLLGIGGGIILVPATLLVLSKMNVDTGVAMHIALATSLTVIIFSASTSAYAHRRLGTIDTAVFSKWWLPVLIGALLGGLAAKWVSGDFLRIGFALFAAVVGMKFLTGKQSPSQEATRTPRPTSPNWPVAIGFASSWLGIGGGSFSVPLLSSRGHSMQRAVGTSAAIGLVIAIPASIGFIVGGWSAAARPPLSVGYVHIPSVLAFGVGAMLLAPVGAKLSSRTPQRTLKRVFGGFLVIAALRIASKILF
ncbi:MAG: sulfite exporter TauE/SafE family protein [Pseudomonadota bacterium]